MGDREHEIIYSPLCRKFAQDDKAIDIHIYRRVNKDTWILEVVSEDGSSTVWDDRFDSDYDALAEVQATIAYEGMSAFEEDGTADQSKN